jgi:CheY-like chemotaxis protein
LRGTVRVESHPGAGTAIEIEVPGRMVTLAAVVARSPSHVLALAVRGIEQLYPADAVVTDERGEPRFVYQDGFLPVVYLDEALGLPRGHFARESAAARALADEAALSGAVEPGIAAVVRRDDGELVVLITPELSQTRSLVVRPLPAWLPRIEAIEGAAVLGDGSVAPVIDLPTLLAREPAALPVPDEMPFEPRALPVCLVVDDSVSVRRSMETFMHDLGFAVDTAGDGVEALALVERRVPDLAIVDLEMPRMNGIELAAALRADERTHGIGLIMITSRYSEKHRAMALDAGVDAFMTKPYTEDELGAIVRSCLEARTRVG